MAISAFYRSIRERVGTSLLLIPAVAAVVRDSRQRVLLVQHHDDAWGLPAGSVEPGESPSVAIVREVHEETGLHVRATRVAAVLGGDSCRTRYRNGDLVEYVVTVFECEIVGGMLVQGTDETKAAAYFTLEEMPRLAFEYPKEIFRNDTLTAYFAAAGSP